MKAVLRNQYGGPDTLFVEEMKKPEPKSKEIRVKVISSAITTADTMLRAGRPKFARFFLGLRRPKNPLVGTGFSGFVEAVGSDVSEFSLGDEVYGETSMQFGANAEFVCVEEKGVVRHKPDDISFDEASVMCDGPLTSLNFLSELTKVKEGDKVLINAASGSLGTAAVQIAKNMGAHVTAVCSARNHVLVKGLGADSVIDYKLEDFTKNGKYDVIYDTIGSSSFRKCKKALSSDGKYLSPVLSGGLLILQLFNFTRKKKALFAATGMEAAPKLKELLSKLETSFGNKQLKMVIDHTYEMDQVVEAHRYVESGRKRGNVVLKIVPSLASAF